MIVAIAAVPTWSPWDWEGRFCRVPWLKQIALFLSVLNVEIGLQSFFLFFFFKTIF